jgi:hypothetical protein
MLANQVDDRYPRPAGIVQIRETIRKSGAEMKQSARRFLRHAGVAVRRSRRNAFEQAKDAAHVSDSVKGGNDVNLRGAGVGKASVDSSGEECAN